MEDPIIYRKAMAEDVEAIVELQLRMAWETEQVQLDRQVCSNGVGAVFTNPQLGTYFVAELEGRVIASLLITYEWSDWRARQVWWIQSVYVAPEARRKGVYRGLYERILDLVDRDETIAGIRLYVDRRNVPAQQVYTRLGMNGDHYQVFEKMKDER
ncbi:MAG TPA: GNAT family N-acetyltransferase [Thermoanaerobaculia bacterium]|nr:GNAT family N-acetyltransferase [Thermoanaerobaculia bacterium]